MHICIHKHTCICLLRISDSHLYVRMYKCTCTCNQQSDNCRVIIIVCEITSLHIDDYELIQNCFEDDKFCESIRNRGLNEVRIFSGLVIIA